MNADRKLKMKQALYTVFLTISILILRDSSNGNPVGAERNFLRLLKDAPRAENDEYSEADIEEKENKDAPVKPVANPCKPCSIGSVCCLFEGAYQCCSKVYVGDQERVTIDSENNQAIYNYEDGSIQVADFNKGILSRYDAQNKKCYIAPGLQHTLQEVVDLQEGNAKDKTSYFEEIDAKPIEDHSLLPSPLQDVCRGAPLTWHEKVSKPYAKSTREMDEIRTQKRGWINWKTVGKVIAVTAPVIFGK